MKSSTLYIGTAVLVIGGLVALVVLDVPAEDGTSIEVDARTNREVALSCTTDMATQFHIHPMLSIMVNGEKVEIPANVGIKSGCMNALHTHDNTGKIHVESPVQRDFILGDYFAVWGKTFTKDQILDHKADDTHAVTMTVNGKASEEFDNLILRDNDVIVITYGTK